MANLFKNLSNRGFSNEWMVGPKNRTYSRTAHTIHKAMGAMRSKSAAKNRYKGVFNYVADFFRYASSPELLDLYKKLQARRGHYIDGAMGINADEHPKAFFAAFDKFKSQEENANKRFEEGASSRPRQSARHILYVHIMKYEDVQPSFFINILFKAMPSSYKQIVPSNVSPLTRKSRRAK